MMRSTMNDNSEDDFAPNPFRSSNDTNDLFDAPVPSQQQQNQHQVPFNGQQQPQQQQQQQPFYDAQPDPNSGMMGTFAPAQQQFSPPPPQQPDPSQYLTGAMDNRNPSGGGNPDNQQQQPVSIFSWRGIMNTCFRVDNVTKLFNVDTIDIYLRLKGAVLQFHQPDQFRTAVIGDAGAQDAANNGAVSPSSHAAANVPVGDRKGPDLYGPFWISMTLIFVLGMTSNLSAYMHHQRKKTNDNPDEEFEYDITHLLRATSIVLGFSFGVPTAFWLACQCLGMPAISWAMWVCCYGYSMTAILLGALTAWWLPYGIWHWVTLAAAVGASGLLIVRNLSTPLLSQDAANHAKAAPLLLAILGAHFTYLLILKITFYP